MSRRDFFREQKIKKMVITFSVTLLFVIATCMTIFVMYSKSLEESAKSDLLAVTENEDEIVPNEEIELTSVSTDKTVEDNKNSIVNTSKNENNNKEKISKEVVSSKVEQNEEQISQDSQNIVTENNVQLYFVAPVSGDIIKDYAVDTLVYSETLQEWCTHNGIDIRADKTTVVVASESGTVESIKNDPRYGLTVIIRHANGFKTVYSNLLTTEFVEEGENVEKGQTIATVGNSASFEIADESHLHFEMYKDEISVNPTIYLDK